MTRSMTGYGSAAVESPSFRGTVTVRSLNHRFLDLTVHASRRLAPLEPEIKGRVQERLSRGRVEVSVHAAFEDLDVTVAASRPLVTALVRALRQVKAEHGLAGEIEVAHAVRFPGVLEVVEGPTGLADDRKRDILGLLERALDGLDAMRLAEGENLGQDLARRLTAVEDAARRIAELSQSTRAVRREALMEKVRALSSELGLEDARLYQEVVRLVDRSDVNEEIERLISHVAQFRGALAAPEPCGKRLDFLAQELMREANTIGSKAGSAPLLHEVVALKSEIERLREQVQNVE